MTKPYDQHDMDVLEKMVMSGTMNSKKAKEAYETQQVLGAVARDLRDKQEAEALSFYENARLTERDGKDHRYNEPKGKPTVSDTQIDEAIDSTEIYKRAKELILNAQRGQIGYGLDKYPETLNADTWSIIETIDHILGEGIDELHYLTMLRIKMERLLEEPKAEAFTLYSDGEVYKTYASEPDPLEDRIEPSNIDCKVRLGKDFLDAKFINVFQCSEVLPPSFAIGGHPGGTTSYPAVVVRVGDRLRQVRLSDVIFEEDLT